MISGTIQFLTVSTTPLAKDSTFIVIRIHYPSSSANVASFKVFIIIDKVHLNSLFGIDATLIIKGI
jgi:hypothetical protein